MERLVGKRFVVIGGTGVAGSGAIQAIRQQFGDAAHVTAVWFDRKPDDRSIDGADATLYGDATDPATWDRIDAAADGPVQMLCYATAMGDVGFPAHMATAEQIERANTLSFAPLPALAERFPEATIVAYSTFFNLAHQRVTYGAMAHSKAAIEAWVAEGEPGRRVCIRAGAFHSNSSQAIKLLVRRNAARLAAIDDPILQRYFGGTKPSEAVEAMQQAVFDEERETYGDSGTNGDSLVAAHLAMFAQPEALFVCVCGTRVWTDSTPQPAPPVATATPSA